MKTKKKSLIRFLMLLFAAQLFSSATAGEKQGGLYSNILQSIKTKKPIYFGDSKNSKPIIFVDSEVEPATIVPIFFIVSKALVKAPLGSEVRVPVTLKQANEAITEYAIIARRNHLEPVIQLWIKNDYDDATLRMLLNHIATNQFKKVQINLPIKGCYPSNRNRYIHKPVPPKNQAQQDAAPDG